jgi:recombination associated protein RdgC
MPLLQGTLSARRYTLDPEATVPGYAVIREALDRHAFREPPTPGSEPVVGWVNPKNPLSTSFGNINTWRFDPYVILALRVDQRKVNATMRKAHVNQRVETWCEARGVERCPASVKAEIREQVTDELLRKTTPQTKIYEVLWSTEDNGYLLLGNLSDKIGELVRQVFYRTFGIRLTSFDPRTTLTEDQSEVLDQEPRLVPTFCLWLWWTTEREGCSLVLPALGSLDAWVDSRITLEGIEGSSASSKAVLTGENPSASDEARAALRARKLPEEIRLGLRREDTEWLLTLRAKTFDLTSVKLPIAVGDDLEETVRVRALSYEELFKIITTLWRMFAQARSAADWSDEAKAMKEWVISVPDSDDDDRFRARRESFDADVNALSS